MKDSPEGPSGPDDAKKREIILAMVEILKRTIALLSKKEALDANAMVNAADIAASESSSIDLRLSCVECAQIIKEGRGSKENTVILNLDTAVAGSTYSGVPELDQSEFVQHEFVYTPPPFKEKIYMGNSIIVEGTQEFKDQVSNSIHDLYNTPTGRKLLDAYENTGHEVTIRKTSRGSNIRRTVSFPGLASHLAESAGARRTFGSNSLMYLNPGPETVNGVDLPQGVVLAHELIHAHQFALGYNTKDVGKNDGIEIDGQPDYVPTLELMAVGIPPFENNQFTENKIRAEWDPPIVERQYY